MITMYLKIHENPSGKIVAVCDKELIGQVLEDETRYLDLDKYRNFYMGEHVEEDAVKKALENFGSANVVGERGVRIAIEMGIVEESSVMNINDVPYVQIYRV